MPTGNYCYEYPHPAITADCVIFSLDKELKLRILLVQRGNDPFKGCWAFPGGFMNIDESAEECAVRELQEETGLENIFVEQFHAFSMVRRDPRERIVTLAYTALVHLDDCEARGGDDAVEARWFTFDQVPALAFDHAHMLHKARMYMKKKLYMELQNIETLSFGFDRVSIQAIYDAL